MDFESSSSGEESSEFDNNTKFVMMLKENKIVFSKSQLPTVKKEKEIAIEKISKMCEEQFGEIYNGKKICKKISNMKMEVKRKFDVNATGNKKITYKPWEKMLLELLDSQTNPTLIKFQVSVIYN